MGCLLNAVAHEVNNQLTNLLLGADHARSGGGPEALDMVVEQAQRIAELCRRIQKIGNLHMTADAGTTPAREIVGDFSELHAVLRPEASSLICEVDPALVVAGPRQQLVHLMVLLSGRDATTGLPLRLSWRRESVPRSAWARPGDTVDMAVLRLRRGDPPAAESPEWKRTIERFWEEDHQMDDVVCMAAWEIVRKLRGRLKAYGAPPARDLECAVFLPLSEARA